jgi:capsular polysaccharide export protein
VIDRLGIYYDASTPSTLETLVQDREGNRPLADEAHGLMRAIVDSDLSKYNQAPPFIPPAVMPDAVLVVDQTLAICPLRKATPAPTAFA